MAPSALCVLLVGLLAPACAALACPPPPRAAARAGAGAASLVRGAAVRCARRAAPCASAAEGERAPAAAELGALVGKGGDDRRILIEVSDPAIWAAEKLELTAMAQCAETPDGLRGYLGSYEADGVFPSNKRLCFHAFERFGTPLEQFDGWPKPPSEPPLPDSEKLGLVRDLVGAIHHLHSRGIPHLCVNERSVRIGREAPDGPLRLRLVGAGAGPSLNAANRTFQVPRSWSYTPPEVLSGLIVQV